jgi:YD repeat-containing protein
LIPRAAIFLTTLLFLFSGMIGLCGHAGFGNRFNKLIGATTVQTYGYDFENRLTSIVDTNKGVFTYTYDH